MDSPSALYWQNLLLTDTIYQVDHDLYNDADVNYNKLNECWAEFRYEGCNTQKAQHRRVLLFESRIMIHQIQI